MLAGGDAAKVNFLFASRSGDDPLPGSNAWAIAGSRTASGKPLLSNDMHLEYALPGVWYMTHLEAPGMDVSGVSLPGVPGVVVGHNQRIAWGITNLGFDVQDLYLEKMDDAGHYLFRGQMEQARPGTRNNRRERPAPVETNVLVTRHGPVLVADRRGADEPAVDGGRARFAAIPRARYRPRAELAAVHHGAGTLDRPRIQLRLRRRGRQHRLSRCRQAAQTPRLYGGCAARWLVRRFRMGRLHPLRRTALGLQPSQWHHRDRQSESVSRRLSLSA